MIETKGGALDDIESFMGPVKANILHELSYSEKSMAELSQILQINKNAVKEHMENLEMKGYVKPFFRGKGAGRPSKYYELTEKGLSLLPKRYINLATMLIDEVESEFGKDKLNIVFGKIADKILMNAGWKVASDSETIPKEQKIQHLREFVSTLNELGYYARLEITDDTVRIIRHNCIFYELAKNNNRIICGSLGSQLIDKSINDEFKIKEKFSEGANKCVVEVSI
ncbi:transcriptional regulator [uncultured archaeon]|nr:transcriptional regulator [uncultured archaeon]